VNLDGEILVAGASPRISYRLQFPGPGGIALLAATRCPSGEELPGRGMATFRNSSHPDTPLRRWWLALPRSSPHTLRLRRHVRRVTFPEKAGLVAKLTAARKARTDKGEKCGGRKSLIEREPVAVALARRLAKQGKTLRAIASELAAAGHLSASGKPYAAKRSCGWSSARRPDLCKGRAEGDGSPKTDQPNFAALFIPRSSTYGRRHVYAVASGRSLGRGAGLARRGSPHSGRGYLPPTCRFWSLGGPRGRGGLLGDCLARVGRRAAE
jgi:hypothetical protein